MVATKRAAGKTAAAASKRLKTDPVALKIDIVKDALENKAYETPHIQNAASVREMLIAGATETLRARKENRHPFQEKMSDVIKEVLGAMQTALEESLAEKKEGAAEATGQAAKLEADKEKAKAELAAKKDDLAAKNEAENNARKAHEDAVKAEKDAETAVTDSQKAKNAEVAFQEQTVRIYNENFVALKDNPPEATKERKKLLKDLEPQLKKMDVDASLLVSTPTALLKNLDDRQEFDKMVISQIQAMFEKLQQNAPTTLQAAHTKIADSETAKTTKAAETAAAQAALSAAEEAASAAAQEKKDLEKKVKDAGKAISDHAKASKSVFDAVKKAEDKLGGFGEVMSAFNFLNSDRKQKEEEPAEEEETAGGEDAEIAEE